ncbi:hypothetical protein HMPREF9947_2261 [Propionibacterium sp. 409-HC1]|nr:hypothetical protein HMPREF9947_2261 [Propionibacterium sp. 409-HC1]
MTIAIKMGFLDDSPIVDDQGRLVSRGAEPLSLSGFSTCTRGPSS